MCARYVSVNRVGWNSIVRFFNKFVYEVSLEHMPIKVVIYHLSFKTNSCNKSLPLSLTLSLSLVVLFQIVKSLLSCLLIANTCNVSMYLRKNIPAMPYSRDTSGSGSGKVINPALNDGYRHL